MNSVHLNRAITDIKRNLFLSIITVTTIALSVLIVSTFALFLTNANNILNFWEKGIRLIVYLESGLTPEETEGFQQDIRQMKGVAKVKFVSKEEGLKRLRKQMQGQPSLLADLEANPLPDTLEVWVSPQRRTWKDIEMLAIHIESSHKVADVEYGQNWLKRFTGLLKLFKLTVTLMCTVFFMAAVFIVANTTRLLFFSKNEELRIMRLVGATDRFIKRPFYLEGLLQGGAGGIIGVSVLYIVYLLIAANINLSMVGSFFEIRFLPLPATLGIIVGSMAAGWLGCYISLNRFLKA